VILSTLSEALLAMPTVVGTVVFAVFIGVRRAPSTHRVTSFVGVPLHPIAAIFATTLRVLVCHGHLKQQLS